MNEKIAKQIEREKADIARKEKVVAKIRETLLDLIKNDSDCGIIVHTPGYIKDLEKAYAAIAASERTISLLEYLAEE